MTERLHDPFDDELDRFLHRHAELLDGVPDERAVVGWIEMHSRARLRRVRARTWLIAAAVLALTTAVAISAFVGSPRPNPQVNIIPSVPMEVRTYAEDGYQIDLPTILLEEGNADTADLPRWRGVRTFQAAGLPPRLLYVSYGSPDGVVGLPTEFGSTGVSGPVSISAEILRVPGSFAASHLASLYSAVSVGDSRVGGERAEVTVTEPRVGTRTRVEFVIAVHEGRPLILRFLLIGPFADERNVRAVLERFAFLGS